MQQKKCSNETMRTSNAELAMNNVTEIMMLSVVKNGCGEMRAVPE